MGKEERDKNKKTALAGAAAKVRVYNEKLIAHPGKILFSAYRKACLKVCHDCCMVLSSVLGRSEGGVVGLAAGSGSGPVVALPGGVFTVELEANA